MNPPDMRLSRRAMFGAASSPLLSAFQTAPLSGSVALATTWFALDEEVVRLISRWSDLENTMLRDPAWAALSREQRRVTPAQVGLDEIDNLKEGVQERQHEILERLMTAPTRDVSDALAKLSVVLGVMIPQDYPHCHHLITDIAGSLATFVCPGCRAPLVSCEAGRLPADAAKVWSDPTAEAGGVVGQVTAAIR